jgi:hypothetical protein
VENFLVVKASFSLVFTIFFLALALPVSGRLPGDTITNSKGTTLQTTVSNTILSIDLKLAPACTRPKITRAMIVGEARQVGRMMRWNERWTIDRCGVEVFYLVHFYFRGSVGNFKIEPPH